MREGLRGTIFQDLVDKLRDPDRARKRRRQLRTEQTQALAARDLVALAQAEADAQMQRDLWRIGLTLGGALALFALLAAVLKKRHEQ